MSRGDEFASWQELLALVDHLISRLQTAGFSKEADYLSRWRSTSYTTGTELWGELGLAVRRVQQNRILDADTQADLRRLKSAVHQVWPKI